MKLRNINYTNGENKSSNRAAKKSLVYSKAKSNGIDDGSLKHVGGLKYDEISYEFREAYIMTGYRKPNSSVRECLKSLFVLNNNEIINFWTHFVPFVYAFYNLLKFTSIYNVEKDNFAWPLFIYLTTVCFYLLMSSLAHAFNCMSPTARHLCFIVDYLSISLYGMGSSIAYKAYSLSNIIQDENFFDYFVFLAMCFCLFSNLTSCASRFIVSHRKRRFYRTSSFITQYIFINLPLLYRFLFFYKKNILEWGASWLFGFMSSKSYDVAQLARLSNETNSIYFQNEADYYYVQQSIAAIVSAFLYATHVPERIWPGRFDLFGQSHQIFHLSAFVCTWSQFTALAKDMKQLIVENFSHSHYKFDDDFYVITSTTVNLEYSLVPIVNVKLSYSFIMIMCCVLNALILIFYYFKAVYFNPWSKAEFGCCCSNEQQQPYTNLDINSEKKKVK